MLPFSQRPCHDIFKLFRLFTVHRLLLLKYQIFLMIHFWNKKIVCWHCTVSVTHWTFVILFLKYFSKHGREKIYIYIYQQIMINVTMSKHCKPCIRYLYIYCLLSMKFANNYSIDIVKNPNEWQYQGTLSIYCYFTQFFCLVEQTIRTKFIKF